MQEYLSVAEPFEWLFDDSQRGYKVLTTLRILKIAMVCLVIGTPVIEILQQHLESGTCICHMILLQTVRTVQKEKRRHGTWT